MIWLWFHQQIISCAISLGLDKSLRFICKKDPLLLSISISIERTCSELKIESLSYLLRRVFGQNKKLGSIIKMNYRTNPGIVLSELSRGLINAGIDFQRETEQKVKTVSKKFLECLEEELPRHEKVPISSSQTANATLKLVNEIHKKQDKILEAVTNPAEKIVPSEVHASITQDSSPELSNSKYKKEIEDAKVLLDKEKHAAAKIIYEKLLEDFKADSNVPTMAKFKVHNNLGACFAALGNRPEAARNFRIAFDIVGNTSIIACKNRALASLFEGKPLEGIPFIDAAIALDPNNNDSFNLKATLLRGAGQLDKVIELYTDKGEE